MLYQESYKELKEQFINSIILEDIQKGLASFKELLNVCLKEDYDRTNIIDSLIVDINEVLDCQDVIEAKNKLLKLFDNPNIVYFIYFTLIFPSNNLKLIYDEFIEDYFHYDINLPDYGHSVLDYINPYVEKIIYFIDNTGKVSKDIFNKIAKYNFANYQIAIYWRTQVTSTEDINISIIVDERNFSYDIKDIFNKPNIREFLNELSKNNLILRDKINDFIRKSFNQSEDSCMFYSGL